MHVKKLRVNSTFNLLENIQNLMIALVNLQNDVNRLCKPTEFNTTYWTHLFLIFKVII